MDSTAELELNLRKEQIRRLIEQRREDRRQERFYRHMKTKTTQMIRTSMARIRELEANG